jgi:hypothetical protein
MRTLAAIGALYGFAPSAALKAVAIGMARRWPPASRGSAYATSGLPRLSRCPMMGGP